MNGLEKISVVTPEVTQHVQQRIVVGGHLVVKAVADCVKEKLQGAGGDPLQLFNSLAAVITQEKLDELEVMDPLKKALLSKIVEIAKKYIFQGPTAGCLGMMGVYTSQDSVTNFIMVQAIEAANNLAAELAPTYGDDLVNGVTSELTLEKADEITQSLLEKVAQAQ